ncbi:hypothetical protein [Mesorhizobium caraganae]|jgi:hypothetical protein|uniref:hypothetical protein n=1 Tax=Mesorhizobium caraganae TaxID=483206 RepID=UPI003ECEEF73
MTSLYQQIPYRWRAGIIVLSPDFIFAEKAKSMRIMKTPDGPVATIAPIVAFPKALSVRLTIRSDEAARRKVADTDGTLRRKRQLAESNRLI